MSENTEYSFRMERTSYKSQDLIYEEGARKLVVYVEMSGVPQFDWVGCDTDFQRWTEPKGEVVPTEKQTEILSRLADWSRQQSIRIDIGPPLDMNNYLLEMEKAGHKVERRPDGSVLVHAAPRTFWKRLVAVMKGFLGK